MASFPTLTDPSFSKRVCVLSTFCLCFLCSQANSCGIVESVMNWVKFKAQTQLNKKCSAVKHTKIKGVPKLDDANDAGTGAILDQGLLGLGNTMM